MKYIITAVIAFAFLFGTPQVHAYEQTLEEDIAGLHVVIDLIQEQPKLAPQLKPFLDQIIDRILERVSKEKIKTVSEEKKKSVTKTRPQKIVDGYHPMGTKAHAAKTTFNIPVKAAGDSDIEVGGYDAFVFEIDSVEYSAAEVNALAGYSVHINDSDDDEIGAGYVIRDGKSEQFEIVVIVDAQNTAKGTGIYQLKLKKIEYIEINNGRSGNLDINKKSEEIDLLS